MKMRITDNENMGLILHDKRHSVQSFLKAEESNFINWMYIWNY